jgi:hypothetical protein
VTAVVTVTVSLGPFGAITVRGRAVAATEPGAAGLPP